MQNNSSSGWLSPTCCGLLGPLPSHVSSTRASAQLPHIICDGGMRCKPLDSLTTTVYCSQWSQSPCCSRMLTWGTMLNHLGGTGDETPFISVSDRCLHEASPGSAFNYRVGSNCQTKRDSAQQSLAARRRFRNQWHIHASGLLPSLANCRGVIVSCRLQAAKKQTFIILTFYRLKFYLSLLFSTLKASAELTQRGFWEDVALPYCGYSRC